MAEYPIKITARQENVVFTEDGGVTVNYLMLGPLFSPYDVDVIDMCRREQAKLLDAITRIDAAEVFLGGFKTETSTDRVLARLSDSIPNFTNERYPALARHIAALRRDIEAGVEPENDRVFWLSARMPTKVGLIDRATARAFESNPHQHVRNKDVKRFREAVEACIPPSLSAWRTAPSDVEWVYNRARLRGIDVPIYDLPTTPQVNAPIHTGAVAGNNAFPPIIVDGAADSIPLMEDFLADMRENLSKEDFESRVDDYKRTFRRNFKAMDESNTLSVTSPTQRTPEAPGGVVSFQQVLAFTGFPRKISPEVNGFTEVVNALNGLDGDFVLRITPDQDILEIKNIEDRLGEIDVYDAANSDTEVRSSVYQAKRTELASFAANALHDEDDARGLLVTALVAFGDPNKKVLDENVAATISDVADRGFTLRAVPGAQVALWKAMLPGTRPDPVIKALANPTTAERLAGFAPIRRLAAGDGMGPPIFRIEENCLRKFVHLDLLTGTLRGNGSIMFSGAQGSSKSHTAKLILSWMNDLYIPAFILDPQGEWATAVQAYDSYQVANFANPNVSIDPFVMFADDPDYAARAFVEWFSILFAVRPGTEASAALTTIAQKEYRRDFDLHTTRDVLGHIIKAKKFEWKELEPLAREALINPLLGALVPQLSNGQPVTLPAFTPQKRNIVFMVRGLRLPDPDKPRADYDMEERYTFTVNTAIARITKYYFDRIEGPAGFIADELASYDEQSVLTDLIQTPDREGRKFGKFVIALSQLGADLRKRQYKLINKKIVYRQERVDNAVDAFTWADLPPTEKMIRKMLKGTSPLDPDPNRKRKPIRGREGEGWYSDPVTKVRIKSLNEVLPERARKADTTVTNFERYSNETAAAV